MERCGVDRARDLFYSDLRMLRPSPAYWVPLLMVGSGANTHAATVTFTQSAPAVDAFDFVEVTLAVSGDDARNPFTDATVRGAFGKAGEAARTAVDGFCDSADGSVFRIRFMPSSPGDYAYSVAYRHGGFEKSSEGTFR